MVYCHFTPLSASEKNLFEIPAWVYKTSTSSDDDQSLLANPDSVNRASLPSPSAAGTKGTDRVALKQLQSIFTTVAVRNFCKIGEIVLSESDREGQVSPIIFQCSKYYCSCTFSLPLEEKSGPFYGFNRRSVLAMRKIGRGWIYPSLSIFYGTTDMAPPVSRSNLSIYAMSSAHPEWTLGVTTRGCLLVLKTTMSTLTTAACQTISCVWGNQAYLH